MQEVSRVQHIHECKYIHIFAKKSSWDQLLETTTKITTKDRAHLKSWEKHKIDIKNILRSEQRCNVVILKTTNDENDENKC